MQDLIYRQAAIRWVKTECNPYGKPTLDFETGKKVIEHLKQMPPAQPEIIKCKECKNWDTTWENDWAKNYHYCPLIDGIRYGDWFCADAERRTDE